MTDRIKELHDRGITGLDLSTGDPLCYWAHGEIIRLRAELAATREEVGVLRARALAVGDCSPSSVPNLPDAAFIPNHCAESNHVFLWRHCEQPPFMRAVPGWKIVGYGKAPWPKKDWPLAVMFERTEPPTSEYGNAYGDEMAEGTRIWQHGRGEWVPGHPDNERRMGKANDTLCRPAGDAGGAKKELSK